MTSRWWCLVALALGCASPAPAAAPSDNAGEFVDHEDRCPAVPAQCLVGYDASRDEDGCPDVPPTTTFRLPTGATAIAERLARFLNFLAADVPRLVVGARITVLVEAAPGEDAAETQRRRALVEAALRARGVDESRVVFSPDAPIDVPGADEPPDRVVFRVDGCPPP